MSDAIVREWIGTMEQIVDLLVQDKTLAAEELAKELLVDMKDGLELQ